MSYRYDPRDLNINTYTTKDVLKARGNGDLLSSTKPTAVLESALTAEGRNSPGGPGTGEQPRVWQNQNSEVNPQARPVFLNQHGKWDNNRLPGMIIDSKAQPLTATGAYTAAGTLKKSLNIEGPKAINNDVSPAVNTECTHDAYSWQIRTTDTWDPTVQKLRTARHHGVPDRVPAKQLTEGQAMMLTSRGAQGTLIDAGAEGTPTVLSLTQTGRVGRTTVGPTAPGSESEQIRKESIDGFWARMKGSGGSSQLSLKDITRCHDRLSQHAVAGGHNAHLVGGTWRHLQRPLVGAPLYTDYYGRYDSETGNYYGRSWNHVS